jgi:hypothetical protein
MKKNKKDEKKIKATNNSKEVDAYSIRQNSHYSEGCKAAPDNNLFFEERSNPLSSKGD